MQIALVATGTRGDVQPLLAFATAVQAAGHDVRVVAGSNFSGWIQGHGLAVFPTADVTALFQSPAGLRWAEASSPLVQLRAMRELMRGTIHDTVRDMQQSTAGADVVIGGLLSEPYLQAISEKGGARQLTAALQPTRASAVGATSLLAVLPARTSPLNRWAGTLAEHMTWTLAREGTALLRAALGLPAHNSRSYRAAMRRTPAVYAMSPTVVPPAPDINALISGYWFLDEAVAPPAELVQFLAAGPPPVYVGFGSMPSSDPNALLGMIGAALDAVGRRGVVARGWAGPTRAAVPPHLHVVDSIAHSWLFPQVAAVVHHGGAGTTAAGLRAGRPTLIVPHIADQPYWAGQVHALGVGARPLPRARLTTATLIAHLQPLLTDEALQARAAALGATIRAERGVDNAVAWLETQLR